jgi:queuine tRNA-ribosyltransferase
VGKPAGYQLLKKGQKTDARLGVLHTAHGTVQTPVFMPVGTLGTVKGMTPFELQDLGAQVVLGNTYHLFLRPGTDIIEKAGGLHRFMNWPGTILTDSGGYQVFSLAKLRKMTREGVSFQSHLDGSEFFLSPEKAMEIQAILGSDIAMILDECAPWPATREQIEESLIYTHLWAEKCRACELRQGQLAFAIVQGGVYQDLREESARTLVDLEFDGYAIGGLSVGEPEEEMLKVIDWTAPLLPADKARYLMGVGTPPQILRAISRGIDMFDCVLPTRIARNGSVYTRNGMMPIKAGRYKEDMRPMEQGCQCYACANFSRAYVRHLLNANEILGVRLTTLHNVHFYLNMMREVRAHLQAGTFADYLNDFCQRYESASEL